MILRDILEQIEDNNLPDKWTKWDDIRPNSVFKVCLCFMSEEDTWILAYATHPILIPFYDCEVCGVQPDEKYVLNIWLKHEDYIPKLIKRLGYGERKESEG